jgi:hypothetical protein
MLWLRNCATLLKERWTMLQHTAHSAIRSAQRGLSRDEIEYVQLFGSRFHREGALIYYLRRRDIPAFDQRIGWISALVGTALVVSTDGQTLITAWRNRRNGLKLILKKLDYKSKNRESFDELDDW